MPRADDRVTAYLKRNLDDLWTDAEANAAALVEEIEPLEWDARVSAIDWFIWQLATKMLGQGDAEAVIERNLRAMNTSRTTAKYVEVAQHTLAAVLMKIDTNPRQVANAYHATLLAVSPLAVHRAAFDEWMAETDCEALAMAFRELPGHAFLCMAASVDDTALVMLARDGFRRTMLGFQTGL